MTEKIVEWILAGTGAIALLFIGLYLRGLSQSSRDNASAASSMAANLARLENKVIEVFVTKTEFNGVREDVKDLRTDVTELQIKTGLPVRR